MEPNYPVQPMESIRSDFGRGGGMKRLWIDDQLVLNLEMIGRMAKRPRLCQTYSGVCNGLTLHMRTK